MPDTTLRDLLQYPSLNSLHRIDAQMLVLHACDQDPLNRAWLLAHESDTALPEQITRAQHFAQRRINGEPIAYITGFKEFYCLRLGIDSRVLDPRDDTETLVDWALELLPIHQTLQVLDLGTGSGAIALAVKSQRPLANVTATDASSDALVVARSNADQLGLEVSFFQADHTQRNWFDALAHQKFDLIVSNPPYIAEGDMHLAALSHEPALALTSGSDGLDAIRDIVANASNHLVEGGWILLEHGFDQSIPVQTLLAQAGFAQIATRKDLGDQPRCTAGQK